MTFADITAAVDAAALELFDRAGIPGATFARGAVYGGEIAPQLVAFFALPGGAWGVVEQHQATYRAAHWTAPDVAGKSAEHADLTEAVKAVFG